jgi:hypothetical protein
VPLFLRFTDEACTDEACAALAWECVCFGNVSMCAVECLSLGPNMIHSVSESIGCREKRATNLISSLVVGADFFCSRGQTQKKSSQAHQSFCVGQKFCVPDKLRGKYDSCSGVRLGCA